MENKILAVVNGREIRQSDVELLYANLGPNAAQYKGEEGYKQLVEQLILEEMLYLDARENNMDEAEDYRKALEQLKKSLLAQYSVSQIMASVDVTEDEIKEYYNENKNMFKEGETVVASHILVPTENEANDILSEINNGLSFSEAAQKYSSCPSKEAGGNLGKFGKGQMVPEFEAAVFSMKVGEISAPVKTQFGYHLIQLNEKNKDKELTFDDVREDIVNNIKYSKQSAAYSKKQDELRQKYSVEYKY